MPKTIWARWRWLSDRLELLVLWIVTCMAEITAVGVYMGVWFPGVSSWSPGAVGTGDHGLGQFHCRQGLWGI